MPMFFSTVEVKGEIFRGKVGKSKKQAELNAAKVAYSSFLNERGWSGSAAEVTSPNLVELQHKLEHEFELFPSPTIEYEEPAKESTVDEVQEVGLKETLLEVDTKDSSSAPAELQKEEEIENNEKSFSGSKQGQLMASPTLTQAKVSALPISGPKIGTRSYLLCNRVRVYSSFPDIAFPKGIIVLPISENKWVAVSLEFPNEEGK
ncbi:double-stranded RNA-binding protein 1-like [Corylus avellana]|uniref:double-stranded RNA-binding protein 1-like n=1 Tax=Corylus avellana TaxID=13451 RepID=UPI00286A0076|nr:double-stranded RNA-binding protein 1-like [Corylus avellana]